MIQVGASVSIAQFKAMFFDRDEVKKAVSKGERKALSRFGAAVRADAQSSMLGHAVRKGFGAKSKVTNRQGTAAAGQPPQPHTGLLVKFILFGFDRSSKSEVIGPSRPPAGAGPPALKQLEEGGAATILMGRKGKLRPVRVRFHPHPFMRPAYNREIQNLPKYWQDVIKG